MKRALMLCVVAGVLTLSGGLAGDETAKPRPESPPARVAAIADADLSLYPGSLFEVPDPAGFSWNDEEPGENGRLARPFALAPPRIPHAIADFVPLTVKANSCLECHALAAGAGAPELPPSHRTDLRQSPDRVTTAVTGARYLCLACHVPTSDAQAARTSRLPGP